MRLRVDGQEGSRRLALFGVLCALSMTSAFAATVGTTIASPSSAQAGVATLVTVTSVITDPSVIPASVQLQQLDSNGRVTAIVGTLHDDGLAGDAITGDGTFSLQTTVYQTTPGQVTFRVTAGLRGSLVRALSSPVVVTITGASVALAIDTPSNLLYTNLTPVTVAGSVGDPAATVKINGINAPVTGGRFMASVPLVEGLNTLTAVATNSTGAVSTSTVQATLDTTPPHLTIDSPVAGVMTSASSITVSGTANDIVVGTVNSGDVQVTVNGILAQVANRTYLAANVPLAVGANTINATGRDRAGNGTTVTSTITRVAPGLPPAPTIGMPVITNSLNLVSGNNQTGTIGTSLGSALAVSLIDSSNHPVAGQAVIFTVTGNNGSLAGGGMSAPSIMVNTDSNGRAQAVWTLGQRSGAGIDTVQAVSALAVAPVVFTATSLTSGATQIVVDSGNEQTGALGQALAFPFVAIVTDSGHNRVPNVPVTFTVKQGGGSLNGQLSQTVMSDSNGRALIVLTLGTVAGNDNNRIEASFSGYTGTPVAFLASAKAPGDPANTSISGTVVDNSNNPLTNATIRLYQTNQANNNNLPLQIGTPVMTDVNGMFSIQPAPVGYYKLMADGSTVPGNSAYPTLEFDIVTVSGQNNTLGMPISLPALDKVNQLCVDATHGGTLTLPQSPGFSLTVAPGSATFPGGSRTGCLSVTPVNSDKVPMAPGFGQQPRFIVTIQPVGTIFNPPAPITLPNIEGLTAGAVTEMYSYDHDLSMFVAIGTGTVSSDGSLISSNAGVGVLKAGWHCGGNPNSSGSAGTCPTCKKCSGNDCVTDDSQKPPGKCQTCKNGVVTDFSPTDFIKDSSLQGQVKLPDALLAKANAILQGAGLPVSFDELDANFQGKQKDCCNPADGSIVKNGEKEASINVTLKAKLKDVLLWPPPPNAAIDKTWMLSGFGQIVEVRVVFLAGVVFNSDLIIGGQGGLRISSCGENCGFGGMTAQFANQLGITLSAQGCFESTLTSQVCLPTLDVTPAAVLFTVDGTLGYNQNKCSEGLSGSLKVAGVKFHADFKLPLLPQFSYEATIFDGFCIFGC